VATKATAQVQSEITATAQTAASSIWLPLGPTAVQSQNFGLVTGRISALALDPSDTTGNTLFVGTTGGGVWRSQNAGTSNSANVSFTPLTDNLSALSNVYDASISIGALSVQPGGTGVILAGTGDPNDALDSYYGTGILRSADGGTTWSLISATADQLYSFTGEGFAGFAWGTTSQNLAACGPNPLSAYVVVAAVSQAYEGTLVNAEWPSRSYEGLYYSTDNGLNWCLATITDGSGTDVQGPNDSFALPHGNAATSVVWNKVRQLFIAAVRYHGYYQSSDGITFTRMTNQPGTYAQPGTGLAASAGNCPTRIGKTGAESCPIFRGTLAVNPVTGDTFAWTVDINNKDQGIWQDLCAASSNACASKTITFAQQWDSAALETAPPANTTIANGDYNLTLAAVPSDQETILLAGANDLWKSECPLAQGCQWRNTTHSTVGFCAQVGEYQHALEWNVNNPLEIFVGNDSGLWRSTDAIDESGTTCVSDDATHFQNLNGGLGSLAEVESLSQAGATPYTMMAGLGVNGTAGVSSGSGATTDWPEILSGEGGPVAIDPEIASNWYVNNGAGVSIQLGTPPVGTTAGTFNAVLDYTTAPKADVVKDGLTMTAPAPFLVDPLVNSQLLIGTCRVWRGPADGLNWSDTNAISPIFDGIGNATCSGDPLIRSMAAMALPSGGEVVYVGMYGSLNGGGTLPGHVFSATVNPSNSATPTWTDVTSLNPVSNDTKTMNYYGLDISSIFIDQHDATGKTVYVTVAGSQTPTENVQVLYGSTDGGVHWTALSANLPTAPANSLVVDPLDANTAYIATDAGVYSTREIANCTTVASECWSAYGSQLPNAPVVELSAEPATATMHDLIAATYGRGIWMIPLLTATEVQTTATVSPTSLTFASQAEGASSSAQTVTVTNTGAYTLTPAFNSTSGDFSMTGTATGGCQDATGGCQDASVAPGASCTIEVTFAPTALGSRTGTLTISANMTGPNLTVSLSGTGAPPSVISVSSASLAFTTPIEVGNSSASLSVTINNSSSSAIPFTYTVSGPFAVTNGCTGSSVPATGSCPLSVTFVPTQPGAASGSLSLTDSATDSPQTVTLSGTGLAPPTDTLSLTSLSFPDTFVGQLSATQAVTLTNSGGVNLTGIAVSVSGAFTVTNGCGSILGPNSTPCAISVQFDPTAVGAQTGTLTISDVTRAQPQTVTLSGTGIAPPAFSVSPSGLLTFTGQTVGVASSPQTLTIKNSGGASMAGVDFAISPSSGSGFSCSPNACSATTCGALAPGGSCTVQVVFTPIVAGGASAQLVLTSPTAGVTPLAVQLIGTGESLTGLNVSPAQLAFPIVVPGQTSSSLTVVITNNSSIAANPLTATASSYFSLVQVGGNCGTSLAAGASCSIGVVFTPALSQAYTGTFTVAAPSLTSAVVQLSGTGGVPGSVQAQPSSISFPQTSVGLLSDPVTVTLTNPSGGPNLDSFAVAASTGFKVVNNACPSTLAGGASCTVGVEFVPSSAGAQSSSLTAGSSELAIGATVALSGTGFDFSVAASGSSSQTVANGQTASYQLLITPLLGSQGAFSIQCGTLPAYSSCTFNPTSPSVSTSVPLYQEVQIATGLSTSSARLSRPSAWPVLPLACGLVLLPLALKRRHTGLLLIAALAILAGGISGCASSGGGTLQLPPGSGSGITPAGTYSIPVTVSSNGVQHQFTLTLIVD
jgi:hypothetical protein